MSSVESDEHPEIQNHTVDGHESTSSDTVPQETSTINVEDGVSQDSSLSEHFKPSEHVIEQTTTEQSSDTQGDSAPNMHHKDTTVAQVYTIDYLSPPSSHSPLQTEADLHIPSEVTETKPESLSEVITLQEPQGEQAYIKDTNSSSAMEDVASVEEEQYAADHSIPDNALTQDTAFTTVRQRSCDHGNIC